MNIPKAIKILNGAHNFRDTPYAIDLDDALNLGIEALNRLKHLRRGDPTFGLGLLSGETEE